MTALVKLIIASVLSLISSLSTSDTVKEKDFVTEVKTENCNPHNKCNQASLSGKYNEKVYRLELNCTT